MYEKLGIAIIGCGGIAHAHCQTVLGTDESIRLYMYDVDNQKAQAMCRRYSGAGCFETYEEALASDKVKVYIEGKDVKRVIVIQDKIVNIVVK